MYKQQRLNSYNTQYNILVGELKAYQQVHDMYMLPKKADNLFTMHFPLTASNLSLPQYKLTQVL